MKNLIKTIPHLLVWGIILIVPIVIMMKDGEIDQTRYMSNVLRTVILAILFYLNYWYLIDRLMFQKKFILYILVNLVLIGILIFLQSCAEDTFFPHIHHVQQQIQPHLQPQMGMDDPKPHRPPYEIMFFSNYLLNILVVGSSVALRMTTRWHRDSIAFEQAKSEQLQANLKNLRSQLNPHFLFNTLNNIYSLIAIDQNKAQESVHRLSNLLRYVLYENNTQFVSVEKELEFTRNYIDLMKLRIGSGIKLNVMIQNDGNNENIASLMFITLIENAFKHGASNAKENFINIQIVVDKDDTISCRVENSISDSSTPVLEDPNSGIGLTNLRKRLELLYPKKHKFVAGPLKDSYLALLEINMKG